MLSKLSILSIIHLYFVSSITYSAEFKHFKLKGELKEIQIELNKHSDSKNKLNSRSFSIKSSVPTTPTIPNIYDDLNNMLSGSYNNIGMSQVNNLIENYDLGGGVHNFSGFTWYKPMLNYQISANREVAPYTSTSITDKWIVSDTFTIYVEAATLLTNLKEKNLIDITDKTIGTFAGLTFSRVYTYKHFSDTYLDGLSADFSKLFMSFNKLNNIGVFELPEYEVIAKTDYFTYNAGGLISAPVGNGLDLQAGVIINNSFKTEVLVQSVGQDDKSSKDELIRVSINKKSDKMLGSKIELQYDFFNLLKLSLLSNELEYTFSKSNTTSFSFYEKDKDLIYGNGRHQLEFKNILKGKDTIYAWTQNIVSQEKREKENFSSKFGFLLFGTMKKRATEQIKIIKNGIEKTFFKNYSEKSIYLQSLFSRLYRKVIQKIFNFETVVSNRAELKKKLTIDYEQMKNLGAASVKDETNFSLKLSTFFHVNNTKKWYHRKFHKAAIRQSKSFTSLPREVIKKISSKEFIGPITINSTIEINEAALIYFNQLSEDSILASSIKICKINKRYINELYDKKLRKKLFRSRMNSRVRCVKKLITRYIKYISTYINYEKIDLMKFKKFIGYYFSKSKSINDLKLLFGKDNIFIHGDLTARISGTKSDFLTYFNEGEFRGLGVINQYRDTNLVTKIKTKNND